MSEQIKDVDLGWNKFKKQAKLLHNSYTKIGIQGNAGEEKGGASIVMVGVYNEFGTPNAKAPIPARPFMRTSFDEQKKEIHRIQESQYVKILQGKTTVKRALGLLGEFMTGKVKEKITKITDPPNAESTRKRKEGFGKSSEASVAKVNPLIDTGRMRASVTHIEVIQGKAKGTNK